MTRDGWDEPGDPIEDMRAYMRQLAETIEREDGIRRPIGLVVSPRVFEILENRIVAETLIELVWWRKLRRSVSEMMLSYYHCARRAFERLRIARDGREDESDE